jgi:hypothetical protein
MGELERKLSAIERQVAQSVKMPGVRVAKPADLEAAVRRFFAARPEHEMARAIGDLAAARNLAKETWERVRASNVLAVRAGEAARKFAIAGGAAAMTPTGLATPSGGPMVLFDWVRSLPHTYTTRTGRHCLTDRWISEGFLVFDPGAEPPLHGSVDNPWFGMNGPKFRCYYPHSSVADWESCMTSGSSGRWLNRWPQKSVYIKF